MYDLETHFKKLNDEDKKYSALGQISEMSKFLIEITKNIEVVSRNMKECIKAIDPSFINPNDNYNKETSL